MKKGGRMKTALPTETAGGPACFPIPESLKEVSAQEPALGGRWGSVLKFMRFVVQAPCQIHPRRLMGF
jgi:hypothetical protein